jgi:predicted SAM-dependent methyltransferase
MAAPSSSHLVGELRRIVGRSRAQLRMRDLVLSMGRRNLFVHREDLARRYLRGEGIEIGAMALPMRVPPGVVVRQVDRMTRAQLIATQGAAMRGVGDHPERIPEIDVVDDAATLSTFDDASADFVIANHVLEHIEDPIAALGAMLRIIRPGGVLLLTLPDAQHTFDAARARTTVEHLRADHEHGPERSRHDHYEEWARDIEGVGEAQIAQRVAQFAAQDARHHFHVWRLDDFLALLVSVELPAEILHAQAHLEEFAVVLRRLV